MRCAKCGAENPARKPFCGDCGAALVNRCARCGADNPLEKKFCGDCGSALGTDVVPEGGKPSAAEATGGVRIPPERQTSETIDGERKTVTALFADIKDSTEMIRDLDPEEARAPHPRGKPRTQAAASARRGRPDPLISTTRQN